MTDTVVDELPRWDLTPFFESLECRAFTGAHEELTADIARLRARFDEADIRGGEPRPVTAEDIAAVEELVPALNLLFERMRLMGAYLYGRVSTDTTDAEAARLQSKLSADTAPVRTLMTRLAAFTARVGAEPLIEGSPQAADHAFWFSRAARSAEFQMSEAEEDLAGELSLTGAQAWAELHRDVTSQLTAEVPGRGRMPVTAVRGLATDPDPEVRRAAFDAELEAWKRVEVPLAAALNGYKGEANALRTRRGWPDSLAPALFTNNVDRATFDALNEAVTGALDDFARYNRTKARRLGHGDAGLPWWDLIAPVGEGRRLDWSEAIDAVHDAFASYSPRLAALVQRAAAERWIDAGPRAGKVGGAYCMPVVDDVSRVLCNFDGSFDGVQTLAHELGHAYHNTNLGHRTWMQRATPMALAETASIFCETVMVQAGLASATSDGPRLALLGTDLDGATQVVVDIRSRLLFEQALHEERESGKLAPERLCELMTHAQRAAYRDGVDHDHLHPWMWAVKGHYFTAYYNWPYTFGLLFGLGLYAEYQRDPDRFRSGYDDLLSSTGLGEAAELAARFGIDVRSVDFWTASLDVLRARIDQYVALAAAT